MSTDTPPPPAAVAATPAAPGDAPLGAAPPAPPLSRRALTWVASTYFGEGLPWSFIHQMATEFLTATGASNTQIAATSWFHLAVTFKFAWSPVVDIFGRKRTWVVLLQALLGLGMLTIALVVPGRKLGYLWALLSGLAILHATHDVACDGFYLLALDKVRQALYSGVRTAAFRAAMIVGTSVLVYLAGRTNWSWGFGAAGLLMLLVSVLNAALMPRPAADEPAEEAASRPGALVSSGPSERGRGWRRERLTDAASVEVGGHGRAFLTAYRTFLDQPQAGRVLSFMLFYKLGDIMMFAMSKPLLRDIGIDTSHRAVLNFAGTTSFIVASIVGGALIARHGLGRCLVPMTFLQNLAIPLYVVMAVVKPTFLGVFPFVVAEQFAAGIGAAAHVVFLMQRCRTAFSASHYAFATAIVSIASTFSGAIAGPLNERLGHPWFFALAFVASWPSLVLVLFVPRTPIDGAA